MGLSRDQLLAAASSANVLTCIVPDIGEVQLRVMTGSERNAYESFALAKDKPAADWREQLLVRTIADEKGTRLFTDTEVAAIAGFSAPVIDALFLAAFRHNRMGKEAEADAKKN